MDNQNITASDSDNYIKFVMHLEIEITEEEGAYIATCPVLDVVTQGSSHKNALQMIKEAVSLFVETAYDMNTLDDILKEAGFTKSVKTISTQTDKKESIEVPFSLVMARSFGLVPETAPC